MTKSLMIVPSGTDGVVSVIISADNDEVFAAFDCLGASLIGMVAQALDKRVTLSDRSGDRDADPEPLEVPDTLPEEWT